MELSDPDADCRLNRTTPAALVTVPPMKNQEHQPSIEAALLPHLDAAYASARWLLHTDSGAQDVVQDAFVRALRFFDGFHGNDARPWLLQIVRYVCWTHLRESRRGGTFVELDEEVDSNLWDPAMARPKAARKSCWPGTRRLRA